MSNETDWKQTSVGRVALALLAFTEGGDSGQPELSVTAIAQQIGRERSQVSRMLKTLAHAGLLEQDPTTKLYRLGWRIHHLASRAGDQQILTVMRPAMRDLVARTRETALVSVLSGNRSFTIARERSPQSLQAGGWVGRTSPLHASASGRALILGQTDEMVRSLVVEDLGHTTLGPKAPPSIDALLGILEKERAQGFAVAIDQLEDGLTSVGAPVIGPNGNVLAALNVSGPTSRIGKSVQRIGADLLAACRQAATRLY